MRRVILFIFSFLFFCVCSNAEELSFSDTLEVNKKTLPQILKSRDCYQKISLLNSLYGPASFSGLKSSDLSYKLDSIIINERNNESTQLEKKEFLSYRLDDEKKQLVVDSYVWDNEREKWKNGVQNYYYFDENDRLDYVELEEFISLEYRLYTLIEYTYENGLLKFESRFDRIDEAEEWGRIVQFEYAYNDDKTLKTAYINEWDTYEQGWAATSYRRFSYNAEGNLQSEIGYKYDSYDAVSTKLFELKYFYDADENLIEIVEYEPGWEEGIFAAERKQENSYSGIGELYRETFYNWDYDSDYWLADVKNEYFTETILEQIFEEQSFLWSTSNTVWEPQQSVRYVAENSFAVEDIEDWNVLEMYLPGYSYNGVVCDKLEMANWENNVWEITESNTYYFSESISVGIEQAEALQFQIYPNPVSRNVQIQSEDYSETTFLLRDLNGRLIQQNTFVNTLQLDLSSLVSGVYLVELISADGNREVKKMIKR